MSRSIIAVLLATSLVCAASAKAPWDDHVYGPEPDWEEYTRIGDAGVRERLSDPAAWSIEWPNGYIRAGWPTGPEKGAGYMTCGIVRAVKPISGGYPSAPFAIAIENGKVTAFKFQPRPRNTLVNMICRQLTETGRFPPPAMMPHADEVTIGTTGLTIKTASDGAHILRVQEGSPGQRAGIAAGTVITSVNAIPLGGLGPAMIRILSNLNGVRLATADGQIFDLVGR